MEGYYLVYIDTNVETPDPENEIIPAIELLGEVLEQFAWIQEIYSPLHDGKNDNLFITKSCDSCIDFENDVQEVFDIYERITG
jgi:Rab GDP dissociation inhibitor